MAARNCSTSLKKRNRADPMRAYDALPPDLRQWLAGAALPWSAASMRRVWDKALKSTRGDRQAACAALSAAERRRLERDVIRIWGKTHPFLAVPDGVGKDVVPKADAVAPRIRLTWATGNMAAVKSTVLANALSDPDVPAFTIKDLMRPSSAGHIAELKAS